MRVHRRVSAQRLVHTDVRRPATLLVIVAVVAAACTAPVEPSYSGSPAVTPTSAVAGLAPGASVSERVHWSGFTGGFVLPDVPVAIETNVLNGWYRGEIPPDHDRRGIRVTVHTWLRTGNTRLPRLLLGQAVDAALTDEGFRTWLRKSRNWTFAEVDYDTDTWTIGLRAAQILPEAMVTVDARTGRVLSVVFR